MSYQVCKGLAPEEASEDGMISNIEKKSEIKGQIKPCPGLDGPNNRS